MHPMNADPNVPIAAFTEYAGAHYWVASHLMQLLGVWLMSAALVLLLRRLLDGPGADFAALATAGVIAGVATAGALQAVDGIALKIMVDGWAAAPGAAKPVLFQTAFAVRQIEIGLASMTSLLFGLAVSMYGGALWLNAALPRWFAVLSFAGGVPTAIAGIVMAFTGFSNLAMAINLPAGLVLILLMFVLGVYGWRHSIF